jgi:hypothetical protein
MNIYVGNLDFNIEENTLAKVFEPFGLVNSAKIISDKFSGRSKDLVLSQWMIKMKQLTQSKNLMGLF